MRTTIVSLLALTLATGCTTMIDGWSSSNVEGTIAASGDADAWKIEGSQIGQEGLVMHLGDRTVTFFDWVEKTGSNGEYVGFSIKVTGADVLGYNVKSSGEVVHSTGTTWIAANGPDGGDKSPGISNVDFGENCTDGSCGDGDGDGGGDEGGDGSDGCIEGCDEGSGGDGSDGGGDGSDGGDGDGDGDGGGDGTGTGTDGGGGGGDGDCFEPGGCNGPTLPPSVSDGDDGTGGCIEGCDDGGGGAVLL